LDSLKLSLVYFQKIVFTEKIVYSKGEGNDIIKKEMSFL
jgi:hypothetical protein